MPADAIAAILAVAKPLAASDGNIPTAIDFLSLIRSSKPTSLRHGVLEPSFCLVLQGRKRMHIGSAVYTYGPGSFVVSVIDLPTAGHVITATKAEPYLGLRLGITPTEAAGVAHEAGLSNVRTKARAAPAAFVAEGEEALLDAIYRLVKLLEAPAHAAFLAPLIRREVIFRLLTSEHGPTIYQDTVLDHQEPGVGKAIAWLKLHFDQPLKIEQLAKRANMSVSSLHHKFKAVTTMGPLQYQKQLRLQEARRRLLAGADDAGTVAFQVGYESPSQFSREYRRLFGAPPRQDVKQLRRLPEVDDLQNQPYQPRRAK